MRTSNRDENKMKSFHSCGPRLRRVAWQRTRKRLLQKARDTRRQRGGVLGLFVSIDFKYCICIASFILKRWEKRKSFFFFRYSFNEVSHRDIVNLKFNRVQFNLLKKTLFYS